MPVVPMRLLRVPQPFDHPDCLFEPKIDGFRAIADVKGHHCTLISRNNHLFKSWPQLNEEIAHAVRANRVILDGEICCLDPDGRSNFKNLLFRREWPHYYVFDILSLEGKDLTRVPLIERKWILIDVLPKIESRLLYLDHVEGRGTDLFRVACDHDLEGIVGKWAHGTYQTNGRSTSWVKIKNPEYSQIQDRHELFESRTSHHRGTTMLPELRFA